MVPDIFDVIRSRVAVVAERASFVAIDEKAIRRLGEELAPVLAPPAYDTSLHYLGTAEDTTAYLVTLDAVNFGSGYFPFFAKRPGLSGYGTVALALTERFRERGPLDARELSRISPQACARLFGQDDRHPALQEWARWVSRAWNDLGEDLLRRFDGDPVRLVQAARGSAAALVEILDAQPLFHDVAIYDGAEIPFFKRAQILASDLALGLEPLRGSPFDDLERLTLFADNLVPHVLRCAGVLRYEPGLADAIERGDLLPAGSPQEIEIRACAIHATELLVAELRRRGASVTARVLDVALWSSGQSPNVKSRYPRHRTRTPFY
ncbi:MAG: queuosine salvage family protein [Candidatus Bipolaricaulota bacterium]